MDQEATRQGFPSAQHYIYLNYHSELLRKTYLGASFLLLLFLLLRLLGLEIGLTLSTSFLR